MNQPAFGGLTAETADAADGARRLTVKQVMQAVNAGADLVMHDPELSGAFSGRDSDLASLIVNAIGAFLEAADPASVTLDAVITDSYDVDVDYWPEAGEWSQGPSSARTYSDTASADVAVARRARAWVWQFTVSQDPRAVGTAASLPDAQAAADKFADEWASENLPSPVPSIVRDWI